VVVLVGLADRAPALSGGQVCYAEAFSLAIYYLSTRHRRQVPQKSPDHSKRALRKSPTKSTGALFKSPTNTNTHRRRQFVDVFVLGGGGGVSAALAASTGGLTVGLAEGRAVEVSAGVGGEAGDASQAHGPAPSAGALPTCFG